MVSRDVTKGLVDDTKVHLTNLTVYIPFDGRYMLDPQMTWHTKVGCCIAPQHIKLDVMVLCSGGLRFAVELAEQRALPCGSSVGSVGTRFLAKDFLSSPGLDPRLIASRSETYVRKGLVDDTKVHSTMYIPFDGRDTLNP